MAIYRELTKLFYASPQKDIKLLGVACFNLSKLNSIQLELFNNIEKELKLTTALDVINNKWGKFVVTPANMITKENYVPDRIGFGSV
jgi:DNA polymerase-4